MDSPDIMEKRARKIVETAMRLAEKGGYAAVRLRDVASEAGVALGTVYKRFQSKEDILVASLELLHIEFKQHLSDDPITGETKLERLCNFFTRFTDWLCDRPNFIRAVLRAMAAGEPELAEKIARFHGHVAMLITAAMIKADDVEADFTTLPEREMELLFILQGIWFASMVGWSSGLHMQGDIVTQVHSASELMLLGIETQRQREADQST